MFLKFYFLYVQVKPEGFQVFENIAYIDASINSLSLGVDLLSVSFVLHKAVF